MKPNKITLIGMPCSGKSTVGNILATKLGYEFFDLDKMVEEKEGVSLIEVMNAKGATFFRDMEYSFLKDIKPEQKAVISPAGSIIYQIQAMEWISQNTEVYFLDTPFEIIADRLQKTPKAVQNLKEKGLKRIWDERIPIYTKYADSVIETRTLSTTQIVNKIVENYNS